MPGFDCAQRGMATTHKNAPTHAGPSGDRVDPADCMRVVGFFSIDLSELVEVLKSHGFNFYEGTTNRVYLELKAEDDASESEAPDGCPKELRLCFRITFDHLARGRQ